MAIVDRLSGASRIGLGLAAVGRPGYINLGRAADLPAERTVEALRASAHDLLDRAYASGIRYFDAARSYGRAEEFLAEWLRARPDAGGEGATPDAVALAAALHQPWATVVLSGAATGDQLASNLRAEALTVDPARWASLAVPADRYWPERSRLPWA